MNTKIRLLISAAILALLAYNTAHADANPYIYQHPPVCTPPTLPSPNEIGGSVLDPLPSGWYYDYNTGFWFGPDGLWQWSDGVRDFEPVSEPPPPSRPEWAIFDMESNGTYYFAGGYYNGHYFAEGYYLPDEIS